MITDALLTLSGAISGNTATGQLVTALGNTVSTNVLDDQVAIDLGKGEPLEIAIEVLQTLTSGGAATVQFQLVDADDAGITTNVQVVVQTDAIPFATLVAGTQVPLHLDRVDPYPARRYYALRYVIGTAALTNATGQFFAAIVKSIADKQVNYGSGFAVL